MYATIDINGNNAINDSQGNARNGNGQYYR